MKDSSPVHRSNSVYKMARNVFYPVCKAVVPEAAAGFFLGTMLSVSLVIYFKSLINYCEVGLKPIESSMSSWTMVGSSDFPSWPGKSCEGVGSFGKSILPFRSASDISYCNESIELSEKIQCVLQGQTPGDTVFYTVLDIHYREAIGNYIHTMVQFGVPFLMLALNKDVIPYLKIYNAPFIDFSSVPPQYERRDHLAIAKMLPGYELLKLQHSVFFSEMDVFFKSSPLQIIRSGDEFLVAAHSYSPEINFGVFFANHSKNSLSLFEEYLKFARLQPGFSAMCGTADQKLLYALLIEGDWECIKSATHVPVKWRRWTLNEVYHNPATDNYTEANNIGEPNRVVVHLSFGLGLADNRIFRAKELSLWRDPSYHRIKRYLTWSIEPATFKQNFVGVLILSELLDRVIIIPQYYWMDDRIQMTTFACNFDYVVYPFSEDLKLRLAYEYSDDTLYWNDAKGETIDRITKMRYQAFEPTVIHVKVSLNISSLLLFASKYPIIERKLNNLGYMGKA